MIATGPICMCTDSFLRVTAWRLRDAIEVARVALDTHTVFVVWALAAFVAVVAFGVLSAWLVPQVHTSKKVIK